MADFILVEGAHVMDFKVAAILYFVLITFLFTAPLLSFTGKLINAREQSVFKNYDFVNGIYRELQRKIAKGYDNVSAEDLNDPGYSSTADLSAVVDNTLRRKYIPFTLMDFVPLWVTAFIPFLAVIAMEIPLIELAKEIFSLVA